MRIGGEPEVNEAGPGEQAGHKDVNGRDRPPEDEEVSAVWPDFEPVEVLVAEEDPENQLTE